MQGTWVELTSFSHQCLFRIVPPYCGQCSVFAMAEKLAPRRDSARVCYGIGSSRDPVLWLDRFTHPLPCWTFLLRYT